MRRPQRPGWPRTGSSGAISTCAGKHKRPTSSSSPPDRSDHETTIVGDRADPGCRPRCLQSRRAIPGGARARNAPVGHPGPQRQRTAGGAGGCRGRTGHGCHRRSIGAHTVAPGETVDVTFTVPPGEGWAIFVNPGPQLGPLILAIDVPPDASGRLQSPSRSARRARASRHLGNAAGSVTESGARHPECCLGERSWPACSRSAYAWRMTGPGSSAGDAAARNEQFWRDYLLNYSRAQAFARPIFSRLPSSPRCQLCGSPFHGFGGRLMRAIGKAQSTANPRTCNQCER